jgi:hypothetical protein
MPTCNVTVHLSAACGNRAERHDGVSVSAKGAFYLVRYPDGRTVKYPLRNVASIEEGCGGGGGSRGKARDAGPTGLSCSTSPVP